MTLTPTETSKQKVSAYYQLVDVSTTLDDAYKFTRNPEMVQQIVDMFDDDAVYVRQGWEATPARGKQALTGFFGSQRFLVGQHEVKSVEALDGVPDSIAMELRRNFSDTNAENLYTVKVKGVFTGAKMDVGKDGAEYAGGTPLPFTDYWVFEGHKVKFRYSEIERENRKERY